MMHLFLTVVLVLVVWGERGAATAPVGTCLSGATPFQLDTSCALGWYCPWYDASDSNTYPVQCAPTDDCTLDRLSTEFCAPQGTYEPTLCPKGYYCPTPLTQVECPEGYICPLGQYEPTKCPSLTTCPAGSHSKTEYSSIVFFLIGLSAALLVYTLAMRYKLSQQHVETDRCAVIPVDHRLLSEGEKKDEETGEKRDHTRPQSPNAVIPLSQATSATELLCDGFKRARGSLPLFLLEFTDLSLTVPLKKKSVLSSASSLFFKPSEASNDTDTEPHSLTVLKGVTGALQPGKVTAIMGPSGAGKTSLLTVLLGKTEHSWTVGGHLTVNHMPEDLARFRKVIGYVPQEDIMHRDLTVHENIHFSALVRLPNSWTTAQRQQHVEAIIVALQLAHVQHTLIGDEVRRGVSGGQRKRVNIGMELAAAPSLLLLDEPTSGLDSTAAMHLCTLLRNLARQSRCTVAMVIHQPRREIWESLDDLLLLAPGGLTVYQGPQQAAETYFAQELRLTLSAQDNPADAILDHIAAHAADCVAHWKDHGLVQFQQSLLAEKQNLVSAIEEEERLYNRQSGESQKEGGSVSAKIEPFPYSSRYFAPLRPTAPWVTQFFGVFLRNLTKQCNNWSALGLEVGLAIFASGLMGALAEVSYQGVLQPPYVLLSPTPLEGLIAGFFFNVGLAVSLAAASAGVAVFGEEMVIYRREIAAGHSHSAYYVGTVMAQVPRLLLDALFFASLFHLVNQPLVNYQTMFWIVFLLYSAIYGLAFIVSFAVSRASAPLLSVVLSLIFSTMTAKGDIPEEVQYFSASRWAVEAIFSIETKPYRHIMQVEDVSAENGGYTLDRVPFDLGMMFIVSIVYRVVAYAVMRYADRELLRK